MRKTNDVILGKESTIKSVIGRLGRLPKCRTALDCIQTGYQQNTQNVQGMRLTSCMVLCIINVQSPLQAPQLSRDVPTDADFIRGKTDVVSQTIKETSYTLLLINHFQ